MFWVLIRIASPSDSNEYPQHMFYREIKKVFLNYLLPSLSVLLYTCPCKLIRIKEMTKIKRLHMYKFALNSIISKHAILFSIGLFYTRYMYICIVKHLIPFYLFYEIIKISFKYKAYLFNKPAFISGNKSIYT